MGRMALFKRPDRSILDGLREALGGNPTVLAHGTGDGVVLLGTKEHLARRVGEAWQVWPWEQVASGSWNGEASSFRWKTIDGEKFEALLKEPGQLPMLFRERVQASTLVTTVIEATRGQVQVIGRRGLGDDGTVHWYAVPSGGADLNEPATRAAVVAETDRLQANYL